MIAYELERPTPASGRGPVRTRRSAAARRWAAGRDERRTSAPNDRPRRRLISLPDGASAAGRLTARPTATRADSRSRSTADGRVRRRCRGSGDGPIDAVDRASGERRGARLACSLGRVRPRRDSSSRDVPRSRDVVQLIARRADPRSSWADAARRSRAAGSGKPRRPIRARRMRARAADETPVRRAAAGRLRAASSSLTAIGSRRIRASHQRELVRCHWRVRIPRATARSSAPERRVRRRASRSDTPRPELGCTSTSGAQRAI